MRNVVVVWAIPYMYHAIIWYIYHTDAHDGCCLLFHAEVVTDSKISHPCPLILNPYPPKISILISVSADIRNFDIKNKNTIFH